MEIRIKKEKVMKKIYQNPDIKVIKVQTMQMIAESMDANRTYGNGVGITLSSRQSNDWGDDDDYDE